jgi:hypothetical protein
VPDATQFPRPPPHTDPDPIPEDTEFPPLTDSATFPEGPGSRPPPPLTDPGRVPEDAEPWPSSPFADSNPGYLPPPPSRDPGRVPDPVEFAPPPPPIDTNPFADTPLDDALNAPNFAPLSDAALGDPGRVSDAGGAVGRRSSEGRRKAMVKISANIEIQTQRKLRPVNYVDIDQLISVRGDKRPIAIYVAPRVSNLSPSGVFIYDRTRKEDNSLFLFVGPDAPERLAELGGRLFSDMQSELGCSRAVQVLRTMDSPEFGDLMKLIGGTRAMIPPASGLGDEKLFERNFFMTKLQVHRFVGGAHEELSFDHEQPTLSIFGDRGSAVVDPGDDRLYLYVADFESDDWQENEDRAMAVEWMNQQQEYRGKWIHLFDLSEVPPNLRLIFPDE